MIDICFKIEAFWQKIIIYQIFIAFTPLYTQTHVCDLALRTVSVPTPLANLI